MATEVADQFIRMLILLTEEVVEEASNDMPDISNGFFSPILDHFLNTFGSEFDEILDISAPNLQTYNAYPIVYRYHPDEVSDGILNV